ncbi:MAG TPA: AI-2E family transporter [Usitatibacter sp.]|jgi:predicted PurR-regulated permease PerM|nr:AI-2E family transporter [Usitatibacter sp.]
MTIRTYAPYVVVTLALLALALLIVKLAPVLLLAFAGVVFAAIIRAAANPLITRLKVPSTIAVVVVTLLIAAIVVGGGWLFGQQVTAQAAELWTALQESLDTLRQRVGDSPLLQSIMEQARGATSPETMGKVAKGTATVFGVVIDVALVLFLAVYLALDPITYRDGLVRLFPKATRARVTDALDAAGADLRRWLIGQLGAMVCVGILAAIGLSIAGVPLAVPLGILLGVMDFVPVVGPLIAAIPGVLIAFAQSPHLALWAIVVYLIVQNIEGNVIVPLAQRWAVSLPAALTLVGIVAFGTLLGPAGLFLAMPLIVVTKTLVEKLYLPALE